MIDAVVFDLDGVLLDSEQRWNEAKEQLVRELGGRWRSDAPTVMMGMSSPEWAAYLREELGVAMAADDISRDVNQSDAGGGLQVNSSSVTVNNTIIAGNLRGTASPVADDISRDVVRRMLDGYRRALPLLPGAQDAVRALARRWPLGLASSANREVIDLAHYRTT